MVEFPAAPWHETQATILRELSPPVKMASPFAGSGLAAFFSSAAMATVETASSIANKDFTNSENARFIQTP